jgi:hypothetical protein
MRKFWSQSGTDGEQPSTIAGSPRGISRPDHFDRRSSMSVRTLVLILALASLALPAAASQFTATTWDQALALSQQYDKPILIDFFTEW